MVNKTKIEWTDYTWNPIKGLCPVGCWYCYARKIYKRFDLMSNYVYWDPFTDKYHDVPEGELIFEYECAEDEGVPVLPRFPKKPSKIFICSTIELFHEKIPGDWRCQIFREIKKHPQHTFQILTKFPQNIDRKMPDNVWLGVSIADPLPEHERAYDLLGHSAKIEFVSLEPLIGEYFYSIIPIELFDWVIVGRMTGYGHKHDPKKESIKRIVSDCRRAKTPIFLKDNLKEIWGEPLIQEWPE